MSTYKIINVTPKNAEEHTFFCIKNIKSKEFKNKQLWFNKRYEEGLRLKILKNDTDEPIAYIEYIPGEFAWRPVNANGYMFIHCMYTYSNKEKGKGYASNLVKACEEETAALKMDGIAIMTSKGTWMADKRLLEKLGYSETDKKDRFELMVKKINKKATNPSFVNWTENLKNYQNWHLLYSDQCPWNVKSVEMISKKCKELKIDLKVEKIDTAEKAQSAPSGFGVFNLIHSGKLLSDHYISERRLMNILEKEV